MRLNSRAKKTNKKADASDWNQRIDLIRSAERIRNHDENPVKCKWVKRTDDFSECIHYPMHTVLFDLCCCWNVWRRFKIRLIQSDFWNWLNDSSTKKTHSDTIILLYRWRRRFFHSQPVAMLSWIEKENLLKFMCVSFFRLQKIIFRFVLQINHAKTTQQRKKNSHRRNHDDECIWCVTTQKAAKKKKIK